MSFVGNYCSPATNHMGTAKTERRGGGGGGPKQQKKNFVNTFIHSTRLLRGAPLEIYLRGKYVFYSDLFVKKTFKVKQNQKRKIKKKEG